jgi:hypothetical protein
VWQQFTCESTDSVEERHTCFDTHPERFNRLRFAVAYLFAKYR